MTDMGESPTCLVRSFSQPAATSSEPKEGDPFCALTTSISFGRFMSDTLAWEKWSCFSNNRYLEEAEKSSKPGSVAQKKAYFEAHYKRIAAKKAAALLEQQNAASNDLPEPNVMDETGNNSSMVSESSKSDSNEAIDEMQGKEAPNADLVFAVDANVSNPNVESNKLETDKLEGAELTTEQLVIAESPIQVELPNQHENVENHSKILSTQQEKMPIMDADSERNSASTIMKKQPISSSKSFTNIRASKLRSSLKLSPVQPNKEDKATGISKKTARDLVDNRRSTPKSLHMSINFSSNAGNTSKTSPVIHKIGNSKIVKTFVKTSRDSSKLRSSLKLSPVQPSKEDNTTRICKKTARDSVDKRRSTPKSLHMSINFSSHAAVTSKTSSPFIHKIGNPKIVKTFVKTSGDGLNPPQTLTRASVNGLSVQSSTTPQSERRRSKTVDDCSVSGRRTVDGKSDGINHLKSSGESGPKARRSIVASSFSLRCEERAAKRKEFFQKLEEKTNAKEADKVHLQAKYKEKADDGFKKMCQSTVLRAKSIANSHPETKSPSDCVRKIPLPRPRSPKLGRKPIPGMVQDTGSRPPRRPSVKIDGFKDVTEKSIRNSIHSINSLLRKSMHENTSPNIQL